MKGCTYNDVLGIQAGQGGKRGQKRMMISEWLDQWTRSPSEVKEILQGEYWRA